MEKPNIVYIHSHDTGRYIQPYGHAVPTPHLQHFAEDSVLFRQAFCGNPTCSPSRACLLTGQYAHNNGMLGLAHYGFQLKHPEYHLVHTLKKTGYQTALSGMQHVVPFTLDAYKEIGYDRSLAKGDQDHHEMCLRAHEGAVEFLDQAPKAPFFLSVGLFETHREFPNLEEALPTENPDYCMPPAPLPDTPECREDMARYKVSARMMDKKMGAVLDAIERNGLKENTLVLVTTDHGLAFPNMKCNLMDGGIGVMLMMRWPEKFRGGRVSDAMISQVDFFPTLCDLIDIEKPDWLQGTSFAPILNETKEETRDTIFAETNFHGAYHPMRCVRTKRWKYIKRFYSDYLPPCDDGLSKDFWIEQGWCNGKPEQEMLYDLYLDPNEKNNLIGISQYVQIENELKAKLETWMKETSDPLLEGDIVISDEISVREYDPLMRSLSEDLEMVNHFAMTTGK